MARASPPPGPRSGGVYKGDKDETLTFKVTRGGRLGAKEGPRAERFEIVDRAGRTMGRIRIPESLSKSDEEGMELFDSEGRSVGRLKVKGRGENRSTKVFDSEGRPMGRMRFPEKPGRGGALRVDVFNEEGEQVDRIRIGRRADPDKAHELDNGLEVSFSEGSLKSGDSFKVKVSASRGSKVRANKAFEGRGDQRPDFEPGVQVQAGSFDINGARIEVEGTDSIRSVIKKINDSDAGVRASYNSKDEVVRIRSKGRGDDQTIELGEDSSGFLKAVKLDRARAIAGRSSDLDRSMELVAPLSGIKAGNIRVNDVDIKIDPTRDSLEDVLKRISNSKAGVRATLSDDGQQVQLVTKDPSASLKIEDGKTDFFKSLKIDPGTYRSTRGEGLAAPSVSKDVEEAASSFSALFQGQNNTHSILQRLRNDLASAIKSRLGEKDVLRTDFGLNFDFRPGSGKSGLEFSQDDQIRFRKALRRNSKELQAFFLDADKKTGKNLLQDMIEKLEGVEKGIAGQNPRGLGVDLTA